MKDRLRELFAATLPALDPGRAVTARLRVDAGALTIDQRRIDLSACARVRVVAIGKAAVPMTRAVLDVLERPTDGIVVAPHATPGLVAPGMTVLHAGHPTPDAASLEAARAVEAFLAGGSERDLVLFLLSGGGSALCEAPLAAGITLADVQAFHGCLVGSGLDVVAMNTLRKHASAVKGGRLARLAAPAAQMTLFISDVPSAHPDAVASGPTMADPTTRADCAALLREHAEQLRCLPRTYADLLASPDLEETLEANDPALAASSWHCLLDSASAVDALRTRCAPLGWLLETDAGPDDAPVHDAATRLLRHLRSLKAAHPDRTVAVISAGELSCPVTGQGIGGRNQHFALECALQIEGQPCFVLSAGTDGVDGNSPAAGAIADATTAARARARGLDPRACLTRCDSFTLFAAIGDALMTGPTGTNVRDLRLLVT